ncbi:MAG TPA: transglycosylase SLT domain-containing protein [Patescibacteria group bacterium]|nr:transglycosylase SLT domain-containing protein [Patescibacteria group bacterium]
MADQFNTQTSTNSMLSDLLHNPRRAHEYFRTWQLIQKFPQFKKDNFNKIKTQQQFDALRQKLTDPKQLKQFYSFATPGMPLAINDPLLWQYGPISQTQAVQDVVNLYLSGRHKEPETTHAPEEHKKESHSGVHQEEKEAGKAPSEEKKPEDTASQKSDGEKQITKVPTTPQTPPATATPPVTTTGQTPAPTPSSVSTPQPPPNPPPSPVDPTLVPYLKQAETALQSEYLAQFKQAERDAVARKQGELTRNLQAQGRDETTIRQAVGTQMTAYEYGGHHTRGQLNPWGQKIRTELDDDAERLFSERTGKTFQPGHETRSEFNGKVFINKVEDRVGGITEDEIRRKAKELRFQETQRQQGEKYQTHQTESQARAETRGGQTEPVFATKSGFNAFSERASGRQAELTSMPNEEAEYEEEEFNPEESHPLAREGDFAQEQDEADEDFSPLDETSEGQESDDDNQGPSFPREAEETPPPEPSPQPSPQPTSGGSILPSPQSLLRNQLPGGLGNLTRLGSGATEGASAAAEGVSAAAGAAGEAVSGIGSAIGGLAAGGWVVVLIILVILIIMGILLFISGKNNSQNSSNSTQVSITKAADKQSYLNSDNITYTINVSYTGNPTTLTVTDPLPSNVTYVSSAGPGNPTYTNGTVTWTIPITSSQTGSGAGSSAPVCGMASPTDPPWPTVNQWNSLIVNAINLEKQKEGITVPGNLVKAIMMEESGGIELAPNAWGYTGLMQVGDGNAQGGGSNCDWNQPDYNISTDQGNVNCGVQHLGRGLKTCGGDPMQTIGQYFTGGCDYASAGPDGFGTTPNQYVNTVIGYYNSLNSQTDTTSCSTQ